MTQPIAVTIAFSRVTASGRPQILLHREPLAGGVGLRKQRASPISDVTPFSARGKRAESFLDRLEDLSAPSRPRGRPHADNLAERSGSDAVSAHAPPVDASRRGGVSSQNERG